MKILLDECVTKKLKSYLIGHEVYTVTDKGWNGLFNGKLMAKCVEDNIDILLTIDKNILFQQSIIKYGLTVVVFDAVDSKINTLLQFLIPFENSIQSFEEKVVYTLDLIPELARSLPSSSYLAALAATKNNLFRYSSHHPPSQKS